MKQTHNRRPRGGFTLVEMLVVLAILVLLVSMVVPRIIGSQKKADINAAKTQIGMYKAALERYALDCKKYPASEQGLTALVSKPSDLSENAAWDGPYVSDEIGRDPWGNEYQYKYPPEKGSSDNPDIWSFGPDGEDNTEDDICSWSSGAGAKGSEGNIGKERPAETRREPRGESRKESTTPKRSSPRPPAVRTEKKRANSDL
jgi:general secretion pathway protein G